MSRNRSPLTQTFSKAAPLPQAGKSQVLYFDERLRGFGLRVSRGGKRAYFVEGEVAGMTRRLTLGATSLLTCEQARTIAIGKLAAMKVEQRDLRAEHLASKSAVEQDRKSQLTVRQALEDRLQSNKKLKDSTKALYRYELQKYLGDWMERPLKLISREDVLAKHAEISSRTKSKADNVMKGLSTLYSYAKKVPQLNLDNPVTVLYDAKAWNGSLPRAKPVSDTRLAQFGRVLLELRTTGTWKQGVFADLLWFIAFTGLRVGEAAQLTWDRVDFAEQTIRIDNTKNGLTHVLPLSSMLCRWLLERKIRATAEFVFPSTSASRLGHISGINAELKRLRKSAGVGFETFTPHDLRATFATTADRSGVSVYVLKRLLNHKPGDVTGLVYVRPCDEDLRRAMEVVGTRLEGLLCMPQITEKLTSESA